MSDFTTTMTRVGELPGKGKSGPKRDAAFLAEVESRRAALVADPGAWYLWSEGETRFQRANHVARLLNGALHAETLRRREWPFKVSTRRQGDGTWNFYVAYFPG